eukprot:CAMPEP_0202075114 /NCGR_PEP_ID=MMETSP0964-20121228/4018_1 /ASSEMBLY_ACC=CAM_ASM_000500 /TAXON_ID=4773 /ORGANISM="Schizochytrium aggregatum, Strain ATCC28209" /LENGTH=350 /DNA_ID=CAMNT_0048642295 /DNA_START=98 /DNA_END=1147 /DNA_ORIENTATION=+
MSLSEAALHLATIPRAVAAGEGLCATSCSDSRFVALWATGEAGVVQAPRGHVPTAPAPFDNGGPHVLSFGPGNILAALSGPTLQIWQTSPDGRSCDLKYDLTAALSESLGKGDLASELATCLRFQHEQSQFASLLAVCCGESIAVIDYVRGASCGALRAHVDQQCESFCDCAFAQPSKSVSLVAISEERCIAFDVASKTVMSSITLTTIPLRCMAISAAVGLVLVGDAAGNLHKVKFETSEAGGLTREKKHCMTANAGDGSNSVSSMLAISVLEDPGQALLAFPDQILCVNLFSGAILLDKRLSQTISCISTSDGLYFVAAACFSPLATVARLELASTLPRHCSRHPETE